MRDLLVLNGSPVVASVSTLMLILKDWLCLVWPVVISKGSFSALVCAFSIQVS